VKRVELTQQDLFVLCSMPGTTDISLYIDEQQGPEKFVIHPFIRHAVSTTHISTKKIILNPDFNFTTTEACQIVETVKKDYFLQAHRLLKNIHSNTFQKAILSRIKRHTFESRDNANLFRKLVNRYPKAFTYMFNIPNQGTWIGASPEVLLQSDKNGFKTVALAGTLPAEDDSLPNWSQKEIQEQQIIVDYVKLKLDEKHIPYTLEGPRSSRAGNVYHLKSVFSSKLIIDPVEIALMLHPGPAISGFPIVEALNFISKTETHNREYYCGFLGPVSKDNTSLFINLRCMRLFSDAVCLYIGGGYTADSIIQKEWEETELKSQTLLSVLEDSYIEANGI